MIKILFLWALGLNLIAVIFFFFYAYRQKGVFFNLATLFLFPGTILLGAVLFLTGLTRDTHPATSFFESFNFFAFLLLVLYFLAEWKFKIRMLGTFLPPLALMFIVISIVMPNKTFQLEGVYSNAIFSIHTALSLLGEAFFVLSFIASLFFLIQEKNLKRKKFKGTYFRLPALPVLEKMARLSILAGFPFLTVGVFLGFLLAAGRLGGQWYFDHKIVWTLITWLVYSGLFTTVVSGRIRGKKLAYFLLPAFLLVLTTYILANYLSEFHNFLFQVGMGK